MESAAREVNLSDIAQRIEIGEVEPRMIARRALEVPTARSGGANG